MEVSFVEEIKSLHLKDGELFHGEGILAVTKALLQSGVAYVGGYQGAPVSHLLDVMVQAKPLMQELGVHVEACANEASAAAMLGAEALPRGGALHMMPLGSSGLVVLPEGRIAAWPHGLIERLAGMVPAEADTPRALLAPWLIALAAAAQCRLSLGMGQPGIPPLLLQPQG